MTSKNKSVLYVVVIIAIGLFAASYFGYLQFNLPTAPAGTTPPASTTPTSGMVNVNKQLKIVGVDELAGGALDGTTSAIVIYDTDGKTTLETCTFSSGSCTSAATYQSGKTLWIKYYYDTTIDAYRFWQLSVPQMSAADAESLTSNQVTLKTREAGAYTDSLITSAGLTITDGLDLNTTGTGNDTGTMTYSFYTTSDNTGYPEFYDPVYKMDMKIVLWAEISGTGYSSISLSGFDGSFEQGSAMKYYKYIAPDAVSKYKVGNDYLLAGAGSASFGWNAAGYANATTSYPTLQITLKIYSNDSYMRQYGDYGPYDFSAAEQTVDFMDI